MASCSALGCKNRPQKKIPGVSFHKFPMKEPLRSEWVKAVGRENWQPSQCSQLCSEHFTEEQIDRTSCFRTRIKENEVPKVFKGSSSSLKTESRGRKEVQQCQEESTTNTIPCVIYCAESDDAQPLCISKPSPDTKNGNNQIQNKNGDIQALANSELSAIAKQRLCIQQEYSILPLCIYTSEKTKDGQKDEQNLERQHTDTNNATQQSCDLEMLTFEDDDSNCDEHVNITNDTNEFQKVKYDTLKAQPTASDKSIRYRKYTRRIKALHQSTRRKLKQISKLKDQIRELNAKTFRQEKELAIFRKLKSPHCEFLYKQLCMKPTKGYSPELKEFALTLYRLSPRSYKYVHSKFNVILPHARTLLKWTSKMKSDITNKVSNNDAEKDNVEQAIHTGSGAEQDLSNNNTGNDVK